MSFSGQISIRIYLNLGNFNRMFFCRKSKLNEVKIKKILIIAALFISAVAFSPLRAEDGDGTATLSQNVLYVGTYTKLILEFTAGPGGISAGGGIRIAMPNELKRHGVPSVNQFSQPQIDVPEAYGYRPWSICSWQ